MRLVTDINSEQDRKALKKFVKDLSKMIAQQFPEPNFGIGYGYVDIPKRCDNNLMGLQLIKLANDIGSLRQVCAFAEKIFEKTDQEMVYCYRGAFVVCKEL